MSNIIQNMKSGFDKIKYYLNYVLDVDINNEGYDLYINSSDKDISEIAQILKNSEQEQESKRIALFNSTPVKKNVKKSEKKNCKPSEPSIKKTKTSPIIISNDVQLEGMEPDK